MITKQLHAAVVSLDKVGTLPDETYGDFLFSIMKCRNEDLKPVFQHLLTHKRIDQFPSNSLNAISYYGSSTSEPTISQSIFYIMTPMSIKIL